MATTTQTNPDDQPRTELYRSKYRNMSNCKCNDDTKVDVPVRSISNPSLVKKVASNRQPGQTHTRTPVDEAITHELAKARYLMCDLADHALGRIVQTGLARDILRQFVHDGIVHVFEGKGRHDYNNGEVPLDTESDEVEISIHGAFEDADEHGCVELDIEGNGEWPESSSGDTKRKGRQTRASGKGREKQKMKNYSFRWIEFPKEPIREDELVSFLNDITDRAFAFAKPRLTVTEPRLRHRLMAPQDKTYAIPLSYEPDGEDMRPDFVLLPIEAFADDLSVVDGRYMNFTASRLVGESKNRDLTAGVEQIQRYAHGLKRAQPWVYYVLGLTITRDKAVFLREEASGTERLELMLGDGRGCIELIRILLGLALADAVDLGHNPDVLMNERERVYVATNVGYRLVAGNAVISKAALQKAKQGPDSVPVPISRRAASKARSRYRTASVASSLKRARSEITDDEEEETQQKKRRTGESVVNEVNHIVFFPAAVYGYECLGILFTASSIRGRATTVFCVIDFKDEGKLLALKMSWQDLEHVTEQDAVMEKVMNEERHPNLIVPVRVFKVERKGRPCTTLGAIRGFSDEQIGHLYIENRVLTVSASELKRPVKYFWGVHDFVRGLRGALLGHKHLTESGILHRDISENNIVLGRRPGDERGYLIDLDMAILQEAEKPTPVGSNTSVNLYPRRAARKTSTGQLDNKKARKALRIGTFPYISYNVLLGGRHTHFDDVESFLYVLLLFFFSYAGPLPSAELQKADEDGFVQPIGSGRLSHITNWPKEYADWADGDPRSIGKHKHFAIICRDVGSVEFTRCLDDNWPQALHDPISDLIQDSFTLFSNSIRRPADSLPRVEVSHDQFISTLDEWLDKCSDLEDQFCNCPFKQGPGP